MSKIYVGAIVSLVIIPVSILIRRIVPDPYMDEIFHIPQVQKYCNGDFRSWDPMITTPPGLYYVSLVYVASLFPTMSTPFWNTCTTEILRSTNHVLAVICSILFYEITIHLRASLDRRKAIICSIVLALYPLHWFFTFLYYTDVASLTAVLAMYCACLKKHYNYSALLGALSVLIRQTNIVWVLFVACTGVINTTLSYQRGNMEDDDVSIKEDGGLTYKKYNIMGTNMRKRNFSSVLDMTDHMSLDARSSSTTHTSGLLDEIQVILCMSWQLKQQLLVSFGPFLLLLVAFAAFVRWNGSVVLGAKEDHIVSPHFAQILYFNLVSALATAPLHFNFTQIRRMFRSLRKNKPLRFLLVFLVFIAGFLSVHFFSITHPYLIADNRHYPFYLWRKVIKAHWSTQYILVPLYIYSWISICSVLRKLQRKVWVLAYFLATAAVLVPSPLVEFRYYTIPFYFFILHSPINKYRSWLLMAIIYISVNAFTVTMFLFYPFRWEHEPGIQRLIW